MNYPRCLSNVQGNANIEYSHILPENNAYTTTHVVVVVHKEQGAKTFYGSRRTAAPKKSFIFCFPNTVISSSFTTWWCTVPIMA